MSEPRASYETYLSHSMFVENKKECLTEIFKHVILMSEKQFIENIYFFFFLKMFIPVIKYGICSETQKMPPALSISRRSIWSFSDADVGMNEKLHLH